MRRKSIEVHQIVAFLTKYVFKKSSDVYKWLHLPTLKIHSAIAILGAKAIATLGAKGAKAVGTLAWPENISGEY